MQRKYKSEVSKLESQMEDLRKELSQSRAESKAKDMELGRCKLEGDGMRDEVRWIILHDWPHRAIAFGLLPSHVDSRSGI